MPCLTMSPVRPTFRSFQETEEAAGATGFSTLTMARGSVEIPTGVIGTPCGSALAS